MKSMYKLTNEGKKYLKEGLPEKKLLLLLQVEKEISIDDAKRRLENFLLM